MKLLTSLTDWALCSEASTRPVALIRIGLVFLIWSRWAGELLLYKELSSLGLALSLNFYLATTLMLIGLYSRWSTAWTGVVLMIMYYYFGYEMGKEPWTHHHTYLLAIATCLLSLSPNGKSYSLDRWLAIRKAEQSGQPIPEEKGNLWGMRLIALQLSLIYFWTAWDKTHWGFLGGDRLEHYLMWYYLGSDYPSWPGFHELMVMVSWAGMTSILCIERAGHRESIPVNFSPKLPPSSFSIIETA